MNDSKNCVKCGPKPIVDFNKGPRGHHSYCRACQKEYDRARYQTRKPQECERAKEKRKIQLAEIRAKVRPIKEGPCMDCKQRFHFAAMDFDHRSGTTKLFDVGAACRGGFSLTKIMNEIAKCDLVCANCHRVRTYERRQRSVA